MFSEEFRSGKYADAVVKKITQLSNGEEIRIVHVCGTHEHTISHHGIRSILPSEIELIAGPGCPVCVCAASDIDMAIELAKQGHIITTFGDMIRVPSTESSLAKERTKGADVRVVYGPNDAVEIAKKNPDKEVVFIGVGFETTAPTMAIEIANNPPDNFSILTSLKIIPPAMEILVEIDDLDVDGFLTPGHVSAIIGTEAYTPLAKKYKIPCVAAGFEPLDVLEGIRMLLVQMREGRADSENEYTRVVRPNGNPVAKKILSDVFKIADAPWRGLGILPDSGLFLREEYANYDARLRFDFPEFESIDILPGCRCHEVILGMTNPSECDLYGKRCVPENPYGPCMVGHEGTCRIRYESQGLE
ncbi:MAG: hydrogenase formation protein HypD [Candidatus Lokiarchaeota archaeon]|nr:hydrogenase formation protein HypD [Candidatus Lokiarchaeota archaeon]